MRMIPEHRKPRYSNSHRSWVVPLLHGELALIDERDADLVGQFLWYTDRGYAIRYEGKRRIEMGAFILGASDSSCQIDHKFRNKLDNRRENIRTCTPQQNCWNRGKVASYAKKKTTSRFRGVNLLTIRHPYGTYTYWKGTISIGGRTIHLGYFPDEISAAKAYDGAAREKFGEFANLNFPEESACLSST